LLGWLARRDCGAPKTKRHHDVVGQHDALASDGDNWHSELGGMIAQPPPRVADHRFGILRA
jgi:hypothetical protein